MEAKKKKRRSYRFSEILTGHDLVSNPIPELGVSKSLLMYKISMFYQRHRIAAMELEKDFNCLLVLPWLQEIHASKCLFTEKIKSTVINSN